jgi:hypothetical protein
MRDTTQDDVRYIYAYSEYHGQRYRVEIEIRVADMARFLMAQALRNRTKASRMSFGKAKAKSAT